MRTRYFYGWNVVAATFVMAVLSFGLGFYGLTVYAATLQRLHGWSASAVSAPITIYYIAGALLTAAIAHVYQRLGPRVVVAGGGVAMAVGVAALGTVGSSWQLYPAFLVMAVGWGALSGAAINIILAPWFERRRGLAVSLAFNGATLGGVIVTPLLLPLIATIGWSAATRVAALVLIVVLLAVALGVMRRHPGELGLGPDGDSPRSATGASVTAVSRPRRSDAVGTWRFWSVSITFALGLAAQVGVLTHLVQVVAPIVGSAAAGRAVSTTTAAALDRAAAGRRRRGLDEPTSDRQRDAGRPDRRRVPPGPAGGGLRRLRRLRPLRSRRGQPDDAARPHPGRRVAPATRRGLPIILGDK